MLVTVCVSHEGCCSEEAEGAKEDPLLGLLDHVSLAAIAVVRFWCFFMRESESNKIPEVTTGTMNHLNHSNCNFFQYEVKLLVVWETSWWTRDSSPR